MRSEYQGRRRGGACAADDAADGPPVKGCDPCELPAPARLRERKLKGERGWSEGDTGKGADVEASMDRGSEGRDERRSNAAMALEL